MDKTKKERNNITGGMLYQLIADNFTLVIDSSALKNVSFGAVLYKVKAKAVN